MNDDEQQIRKVIEQWRDASAAGDLATVMTLIADDAVFLRQGHPPMTKDAFSKNFRGLPGKIESKHEIREIRVSGDLAYCWSHITLEINNEHRAGHILTVFRKQAGKWVLSRDANMLA
jgi:uncharacterized protein (TIGR02246 family)